MNKLVTALALGLVFTASAAEPALVQTDFNANFARYFEKVASDEMQGRAPATEGEKRTVAYLVEKRNFVKQHKATVPVFNSVNCLALV